MKQVYKMKTIYLFLIIAFSGFLYVTAQSIPDLEEIKRLEKKLRDAGDKIGEVKPEQKRVSSLETFDDQLDTLSRFRIEETEKLKAIDTEAIEEKEVKFTDLPHFGHDIFKTANIDFDPEIFGPVDDTYPVGPGDEIVITLWGEVELRHDLIVDRQGQIYIPEVGIVKILGLTIDKLQKKLKRVMGASYSSLLKNKAFLDVSFGKLRSIRIFVVGDVNRPGVFTVPAFTAPFNILFYAGGVTKTGSLREVLLVRNDKIVEKLDFYSAITKGIRPSSVRLQNEDVLVVPSAQRNVYLKGVVNKEAIFEIAEGEGIMELITYAGGFKDSAYTEHLQVERIVNNKDRKIIDVNYKALKAAVKNFELLNGDRVLVEAVQRESKNFITLEGPIYGPKRFNFTPNLTIGQLFNYVDSIRGDAYLERVHITRTMDNRRKQMFSVNLQAILDNQSRDFLLEPEDHITIETIDILFPPDSVEIYGAVNIPGQYILKKDMSLKDLIFIAGGFRKDAVVTEAEISRIDPKRSGDDKLAAVMFVTIDSNYAKIIGTSDESFHLEPYDNVFIRSNSDWELQRNVEVRGEVKFPGMYTLLSKTERITDVIVRAGGLKHTAYLPGAIIYRSKDEVGRIGIDFYKIFKDPKREDNIYLQDGDIVTIPERLHTVKVMGGVNFPSSVYYQKGAGMDYYISAAGGYIELADEKHVTVRLASGRPVQRKRFLFWKYWSDDITPGSVVYVPILSERKDTDWTGVTRDVVAILASLVTTLYIVYQIGKN
jgi:polysaccharide export outer membrane protein